eukprot:augustus_masked-scaffold_13-processed-gene-11.79-mRNA-1 protein AED:0.44 eAED:0.44 QI:0/-1/0/1/-1/1/1/0/1531
MWRVSGGIEQLRYIAFEPPMLLPVAGLLSWFTTAKTFSVEVVALIESFPVVFRGQILTAVLKYILDISFDLIRLVPELEVLNVLFKIETCMKKYWSTLDRQEYLTFFLKNFSQSRINNTPEKCVAFLSASLVLISGQHVLEDQSIKMENLVELDDTIVSKEKKAKIKKLLMLFLPYNLVSFPITPLHNYIFTFINSAEVTFLDFEVALKTCRRILEEILKNEQKECDSVLELFHPIVGSLTNEGFPLHKSYLNFDSYVNRVVVDGHPSNEISQKVWKQFRSCFVLIILSTLMSCDAKKFNSKFLKAKTMLSPLLRSPITASEICDFIERIATSDKFRSIWCFDALLDLLIEILSTPANALGNPLLTYVEIFSVLWDASQRYYQNNINDPGLLWKGKNQTSFYKLKSFRHKLFRSRCAVSYEPRFVIQEATALQKLAGYIPVCNLDGVKSLAEHATKLGMLDELKEATYGIALASWSTQGRYVEEVLSTVSIQSTTPYGKLDSVKKILSYNFSQHPSIKEKNFLAQLNLSFEFSPLLRLMETIDIFRYLLSGNKVLALPGNYLLANDLFLELLLQLKFSINPVFEVEKSLYFKQASALMMCIRNISESPTVLRFSLFSKSKEKHVHFDFAGDYKMTSITLCSSRFTFVELPLEKIPIAPLFHGQSISCIRNRVTYAANKIWKSVYSPTPVYAGSFTWSARINNVSPAGNIFFGVSLGPPNLENYVGSESTSWGWIGCRACWSNGRKTKDNFGNRVKTGDIVQVTLVVEKLTSRLIVRIGEVCFGEAFDNLPGMEISVRSKKAFYPVFSFYNSEDSITVLSMSPAQDVEGLKWNYLKTCNFSIPPTAGFSLDSSYETDGENKNMEPSHEHNLQKLISMGFSEASARKAVEMYGADTSACVNFMVLNPDAIAAAEMNAAIRSKRKERSLLVQLHDSFLNSTLSLLGPYFTDEIESFMKLQAISPALNTSAKEISQLSRHQIKHVPKEQEKVSLKEVKTGVEIKVYPHLSCEVSRSLSLNYIIRLKLSVFQKLLRDVTERDIIDLKNKIEKFMYATGTSAQTVNLVQFIEKYYGGNFQVKFCVAAKLLVGLNLRLLDLRSWMFRKSSSAYIKQLCKTKKLIFDEVRLVFFRYEIKKLSKSDESRRPSVVLDRQKQTSSIFDQLFYQLCKKNIDNKLTLPLPELLRHSESWYTIFRGESADDYSGVFREALSLVFEEQFENNTESCKLFLPSPNNVNNTGGSRDLWVPNPNCTSETDILKYKFFGQLIAICVLTENPVPFPAPKIIWKHIIGEPISIKDFLVLDIGLQEQWHTVSTYPADVIRSMVFCFSVTTLDNRVHNLLFDGDNKVIETREDIKLFLRLVRDYKENEVRFQLDAIRDGFYSLLPVHSVKLLSPRLLADIIVGQINLEVDLLKENTVYGDAVLPSDKQIQFFWLALKSFSAKQKEMYLQFVLGRSRLAHNPDSWERKHKIDLLITTEPDKYLPRSHTCFFSIDLPAYSSFDICRKRLLFAITECKTINADETAVAQEASAMISE